MFEASFLDGLTRLNIEIGSSKSRTDDDFMDRVNHSYTTTLLMVCTLVVLGRQFIGKPISCWTPNEFTGAQVEYATLMCWVTSTYFISPEQAQIPADLKLRHKDSINYYQWVPFLLMFQAAMFSLPCIIWRLFNWQSRIHLWTVMELARKAGDISEVVSTRNDQINFVVRHLEDALIVKHRRKQHRQSSGSTTVVQTSVLSTGERADQRLDKDNSWYTTVPLTICHRSRIPGARPCSPQSSSYLIGLYLIVKALYVFNSTGQLFLLARFIGQPTIFYGPQMLMDLVAGTEWYKSGNFPRVTFCDFDMRRMGSNYHRHTLQCVLGINMFNEKIFIFLWFWFVAITALNVNSFLEWCGRSSFETSRISFIRGLLFYSNPTKNNDSAKSTRTADKESSETPDKPKNSSVNAGYQTSISNSLPMTYSFTSETLPDSEKKESTLFTEHVLGQDGVFVLRLIALNVGRHVAAKIAQVIWARFKQANDPGQQMRRRLPPTGTNQSPTPPLPARSRTPSNQSSVYQRRSKHGPSSPHSPPSILAGLLDTRSARSPSTDMSAYRSRVRKQRHHTTRMEQEELIDRSSVFESNSHDSEIQILDTVDNDNPSLNMV